MISQAKPLPRPTNRGVTTVEAAVVITAFFMLIFGVLEASRFLNTRQVLTNAAREGARMAVAPYSGTNTLPTDNAVTAVVNSFLASANITGSTVTVTRAVSITTGLVDTRYTRVRVEKTFQVIPFPGPFANLNVTLRGEALMREETSE